MSAVEPARPVRVRIAPSPTGDPHVGTAYAAMFNIAFARRHGGTFVLRIEDTDRTRFQADSEDQIFDALHWLGLDWAEGPDIGGPFGPYRQSERLPRYAEVAQQLLELGYAYRCWCNSPRLSDLRAEQTAAKRPTGYDRLCLGKTEQERAVLPGFTPDPVIRMLVPDDIDLRFTDLIRGDIGCPFPDDQVLMKSDGFPTYHLAAVVDDHLMQISHIIRGEEWISSTAKQRQLFRWMDWPTPEYAHFPLLRNTDRSKISKRKNPAARLLWFRSEGFLPHALLNFLGLLGYSMPDGREMFDFDEMAESFELDRINTVGPVFDIDKLSWLNGRYVRELPDEEFLRQIADRLPAGVTAHDLRWTVGSLKERTKRYAEVPAELEWLTDDTPPSAAQLSTKGLDPASVAPVLEATADALEQLAEFEPAQIEALLDRVREERDLNRRRTFMTLRVALAGRPVSPPLHETIATLGRERAVHRLRRSAKIAEH